MKNTLKSLRTFTATLLTFGSLAGGADATVVLSFDSGSYDNPSAWSVTNGTISPAHAHDGAFGISDPNWPYSTTITVPVGDTLSAWFRPSSQSSGRFYLSFAADATGANSLVAAPNTGQILFQDNSGYGFTNLNAQTFSFSTQWYRLEVTRDSSTSATGRIFDSDGTTLLTSFAQTGLTRTAEGIGLRSFGGFSIDTVSVTTIPEPTSTFLFGVAALSLAGRRRRNQ